MNVKAEVNVVRFRVLRSRNRGRRDNPMFTDVSKVTSKQIKNAIHAR